MAQVEKECRKTHLDTRVEAAQSDRKIARGMDVTNTGWSAGDNFDRM